MALRKELTPTETFPFPDYPFEDPFPNDDAAKLAALRAAIDKGDASPDVDGDIFDIIDARYNLGLDDEDDE